MLNRDAYLSLLSPNNPTINTSQYARVERAVASIAWRAVLVYHLLPEENGNQHVVFVDVLDTSTPYRWADTAGMAVGWTWDGRREDEKISPRSFEKQPPEPRAQVDLHKYQVTSVWINDPDGWPSDKVHGLRSDVQDVPGNNLFHNSFLVLFKLMTTSVVTPPVIVPPTDGPDEPLTILTPAQVTAAILELQRKVAALESSR